MVVWPENQLPRAEPVWQPAAVRAGTGRLSEREVPGVYDRHGRVHACPLDRSAEERHPCTTFLHAVESSGPAAVSGVSTTTNPPRSNASGGGRCRRSSSSTRPTACP